MILLIDYIKGKVSHFGEDYIVVENNGIGYKIYTSNYTMMNLHEKKENVIIYTQMIVREDDISLCGFFDRKELKVFDLLKTVKGIGTKVALGILSTLPYTELINILIIGDESRLTKVPGIGKKTAQRIILELKDKVGKVNEFKDIDFTSKNVLYAQENKVNDELLEALMSLGYSRGEVQSIIRKIDNNLSLEDGIKEALKLLVK
ncbi:Holliday junction branch migration protein RuvA [Caminicella sporogenes]|nr:Holliday junction branch migration protein RuvA [Caminicella sporogenes]WIF94358.1 Holliday junction branch migration protein RuvA [Caminicella sporogenes]